MVGEGVLHFHLKAASAILTSRQLARVRAHSDIPTPTGSHPGPSIYKTSQQICDCEIFLFFCELPFYYFVLFLYIHTF